MVEITDNSWVIELSKFNAGFAPLAFTDDLTEIGSAGHASSMKNIDCLDGKLKQGPGLSNLTNGTQDGEVDELIRYILDRSPVTDESYALGESKLFKITPTEVVSSASFPHSVTDMTEGTSLAYLKGNLYYFYNKATEGDIGQYDLSSTFTDDWGSSVHTNLEKAKHPVDTKEDIMTFGNGRYVGTYIEGPPATLDVQKLDFGENTEVSDIIFANNQWYIAVNRGISGRIRGQVYLWDGGALETTLADETGVGIQEIGFLMLINGVVWISYKDPTQEGFVIGYISGRQITPMVRYTGDLPDYRQKTLYKGMLLFLSDSIYSAGATVPEFPYQLSQIASSGYSTVGGIGSPFGTPIVASKDGTNYRIAKFSNYSTDSEWESIIFSITQGLNKGTITEITVLTEKLEEGARADLTVISNQDEDESNVMQITGTGKTRHHFTSIGLAPVEDFKIKIDYSNGSTTKNCIIRRIFVKGVFAEL
jgi:hypothetical protein